MKVQSCDWGHNEGKTVFFNGTKMSSIPFKGIDTTVCENIPRKYAKKLLESGKILRVHQNLVAEFRENNGHEKTDEADAKLIYEYYKQHPEKFREWEGDSKLKVLYATFKELQKVRVSTGQRLWSDTDEFNDTLLKNIEKQENEIKKEIKKELENYKVWPWLETVKGINTATAGGLLAFIEDINKFETISALWSYFGLHVVNDKSVKRRKGQQSNFNSKARSLAIGVIGDSFIKQRTPLYRTIYDNEKQRQLHMKHQRGELFEKYGKPYKKGDVNLKLGHAHNRAVRKMVKMFLSHLWQEWRKAENLPLTEPYSIAMLKHETKIEPRGT